MQFWGWLTAISETHHLICLGAWGVRLCPVHLYITNAVWFILSRWLRTMPLILWFDLVDLFSLLSDKKSEKKLLKFRHEIDGTLTRIGGPNFSDILVKELHGNLPGDYHKPRPLPPKLLRTSVNARAREGYMYWYMEKPPPKSKRYKII